MGEVSTWICASKCLGRTILPTSSATTPSSVDAERRGIGGDAERRGIGGTILEASGGPAYGEINIDPPNPALRHKR